MTTIGALPPAERHLEMLDDDLANSIFHIVGHFVVPLRLNLLGLPLNSVRFRATGGRNLHEKSAVDAQDLPGDVRGSRARQVGDVLRANDLRVLQAGTPLSSARTCTRTPGAGRAAT